MITALFDLLAPLFLNADQFQFTDEITDPNG